MEKQLKILKIVCIVMLVLGVLLFLAGAVFYLASVGLVDELGGVPVEGTSEYEMYEWLRTTTSNLLSSAFGLLIISPFGLRAAKRPRKEMRGLIIFYSVFAFIFFVDTIYAIGNENVPFAMMRFVLFAATIALLVFVSNLRKHRVDLAEDELAGPDGPEFKDGFNPKKLGFMRVIEVLCAVNIAVTIAWLTTLIKGNYTLEFNQLLDLLNLIFDGLLFWFIWQRSSATRPFALGFTVFNVTIGTIFNVATGNFEIPNQIFLSTFDIVIFFYFLSSRRAMAILNKPFSLELVKERAEEETQNSFNLRSWAFWRSAIIYFCVFSVVGHWMEAGFCTLIKWGIIPGIYDPTSQIWSDWLYPFPVYGFGTLACILILFPIKNALRKRIASSWKPLVLSFIINALICTAIELILGLLQNQPVDGVYPLWDYSNMFCNFMGQVCLQNSLAFGLVATLMTWVVYPGLEKLMHRLPDNIANALFIIVVIFFAILAALYIVKITV